MGISTVRAEKFVTLLDAVVLTANSEMIPVKGKVNQTIEVITTGFSGTLKFYGSISDDAPALGTAASADNSFFEIEAKDRNNDAGVVGTTGKTYTTDTSIKAYGLNVDAISYFGVKMTRTAGTITVRARATDNA